MEGMLLQPLRWRCVDCVIHHERDVREEQKYMYVARTSNNRVISLGDLYCCLLPRCEALRICRSGFPIATLLHQKKVETLNITIFYWKLDDFPHLQRVRYALQLYQLASYDRIYPSHSRGLPGP